MAGEPLQNLELKRALLRERFEGTRGLGMLLQSCNLAERILVDLANVVVTD